MYIRTTGKILLKHREIISKRRLRVPVRTAKFVGVFELGVAIGRRSNRLGQFDHRRLDRTRRHFGWLRVCSVQIVLYRHMTRSLFNSDTNYSKEKHCGSQVRLPHVHNSFVKRLDVRCSDRGDEKSDVSHGIPRRRR